ncbi:uncharacterized protein JCM6883_003522 [Sporobolomyces salmoneus]|uniref:uncharacterized protein n=1 Tax=Sporobolomyces salmoneus TaxID=183962 RepID=UPI0031789AD3
MLKTYDKIPCPLKKTEKDGIDLLRLNWNRMGEEEKKTWIDGYQHIVDIRLQADEDVRRQQQEARELVVCDDLTLGDIVSSFGSTYISPVDQIISPASSNQLTPTVSSPSRSSL